MQISGQRRKKTINNNKYIEIEYLAKMHLARIARMLSIYVSKDNNYCHFKGEPGQMFAPVRLERYFPARIDRISVLARNLPEPVGSGGLLTLQRF